MEFSSSMASRTGAKSPSDRSPTSCSLTIRLRRAGPSSELHVVRSDYLEGGPRLYFMPKSGEAPVRLSGAASYGIIFRTKTQPKEDQHGTQDCRRQVR